MTRRILRVSESFKAMVPGPHVTPCPLLNFRPKNFMLDLKTPDFHIVVYTHTECQTYQTL